MYPASTQAWLLLAVGISDRPAFADEAPKLGGKRHLVGKAQRIGTGGNLYRFPRVAALDEKPGLP